MSHLRNRHIKTVSKGRGERRGDGRDRHPSPGFGGHGVHGKERMRTEPDLFIKSLYNQNISLYRPCFDQNDTSQLPFMATLRSYSVNKSQPKATVSEPFDASNKTTCNQKHRRRISDFKTKADRLAFAAYRWHNQTGRGSLWATDFECSLRKYQQGSQREQQYYSYIAPIPFHPVQERTYDRNEMVCDQFHRSFKIKIQKPNK